ncbi:hypothetical protein M0813_14790 [Anaeramoeba flamelloides]|uniref:Uncharacterized protein n=1 Tax=Anaeramoeba flamelloides TaxID=1746091 RepID=A0ABQ8Z4E2_9EUKA|nr:hypothetical protein M0813_14790 [Anaeramoeba flamelloides]
MSEENKETMNPDTVYEEGNKLADKLQNSFDEFNKNVTSNIDQMNLSLNEISQLIDSKALEIGIDKDELNKLAQNNQTSVEKVTDSEETSEDEKEINSSSESSRSDPEEN